MAEAGRSAGSPLFVSSRVITKTATDGKAKAKAKQKEKKIGYSRASVSMSPLIPSNNNTTVTPDACSQSINDAQA